MIDFYDIMYLIIHLFDIVIIAKLFSIFLEPKFKSKICCFAAYGLYYLATGLSFILIDIAVITLCVNIITLFLISINYETKITNKILCVAFSYILIFAVEILICAVTGYYDVEVLTPGSYKNIFGQSLIKIATYAVAIIISYLKDIKKDIHVSKSSWLATIFVPITTMYMEFNFIMSDNISKVNACISIIIVLLLNYICLYMYNSLSSVYQSKMNEALLEQEKNYYLNQCELMKESTEQLRAFRHDMKNQLYVIKKMCDDNMNDEVSVQLGKHAEKLDIKTSYSNSGNMIVDSIVNFKLKNADVNGINVETEITIPEKLNIEISDLITVLGNLLDNALTALSSVSKDKNLYLKIIYDRSRVIICVKNTYNTPVKYVNGEIVTTKTDSDNHGYGLKNIKNTVEKYDGYTEITHEACTFSVDILMFV